MRCYKDPFQADVGQLEAFSKQWSPKNIARAAQELRTAEAVNTTVEQPPHGGLSRFRTDCQAGSAGRSYFHGEHVLWM